LCCRHSPLLPPTRPIPAPPPRPISPEAVPESATIARLRGLSRKDLRLIAEEVGKGSGIFPSSYTKRSRQPLLSWFAAHLSDLEDGIKNHPLYPAHG
jgi:hypothetical protein